MRNLRGRYSEEIRLDAGRFPCDRVARESAAPTRAPERVLSPADGHMVRAPPRRAAVLHVAQSAARSGFWWSEYHVTVFIEEGFHAIP